MLTAGRCRMAHAQPSRPRLVLTPLGSGSSPGRWFLRAVAPKTPPFHGGWSEILDRAFAIFPITSPSQESFCLLAHRDASAAFGGDAHGALRWEAPQTTPASLREASL